MENGMKIYQLQNGWNLKIKTIWRKYVEQHEIQTGKDATPMGATDDGDTIETKNQNG